MFFVHLAVGNPQGFTHLSHLSCTFQENRCSWRAAGCSSRHSREGAKVTPLCLCCKIRNERRELVLESFQGEAGAPGGTEESRALCFHGLGELWGRTGEENHTAWGALWQSSWIFHSLFLSGIPTLPCVWEMVLEFS